MGQEHPGRVVDRESAGRFVEGQALGRVELLDLVTTHVEAIHLDGYDRALREYTDELRGRPG